MIYEKIYNLAKKLSGEQPSQLHGRAVTTKWVKGYGKDNLNILDIGCGRGYDLLNISYELTKVGKAYKIYSIELDDFYISECNQKGIFPTKFNVEEKNLPYKNGYFDIVIINQLTEHIKEIYFLFSEIHRILRKDGMLIVGVPNLASLHDRVALLFGQQPTCIKLVGPHVRGITYPGFKKFIEYGGLFKIVDFGGSCFYPFTKKIGAFLSRCFPKLATAIFFKVIKTQNGFFNFVANKLFDTPFRTGGEKNTVQGEPFTKKVHILQPEVAKREPWEK